MLLGKQADGTDAVSGFQHAVAGGGKDRREERAKRLVVLDDQDRRLTERCQRATA